MPYTFSRGYKVFLCSMVMNTLHDWIKSDICKLVILRVMIFYLLFLVLILHFSAAGIPHHSTWWGTLIQIGGS